MKKVLLFCISMLVAASTYADLAQWQTAIGGSNPRNWFRFDETSGTTLVDHGSGGFSGQYVGVTISQPGLFGPNQAANFPGDTTNDDMIQFPANWADATIAGNWTAEFILYKFGSGQGSAQALFNGPNTSVRLEQWNSFGVFGDYRGGVTQYGVADYYLEGTVAPPDEWSHMVFVRSGGQTLIYLNGVLFGSMNNVVDLQLQTLSRSGVDKLKAALDEAVIFDRALSASEVAAHFAATGLTPPAVPPAIATQPQSQSVVIGTPDASVTFTVSASGSLPLDFQWMKDGVDIPGATAEDFTIDTVTPADEGVYSVVVSNAGGSETSDDATLAIVAPPFNEGPNQTVLAGFPASFTVTLPDADGFSFVWKKNGAVIPGQTEDSLLFDGVQATDSGNYILEITLDGTTVAVDASRLIVPAVPSTSYAQTVLADDPLYFWRLGEDPAALDFLDEQGNLDGIYFLNVELGLPGAILGDTDTAAGFNGAIESKGEAWDNYDQPTQFTVELWAMRTGGAGAFTSPITDRDLNNDVDPPYRKGWTFYATSANNWQFRIGDGSPDWVTIDGPAVVDGKWTQIVGTYNEATREMAFYIDGALVGTQTADYAPIDPIELPPTIRIAAGATEATDGSFFFIGKIDEVAIYDYPLSATDVAGHFAAAFDPSVAPVITQDPLATEVVEGYSATLSVAALSGTPLSYQWKKGGADLPGETSPTLNLTDVMTEDAGSYGVVVTNAAGSSSSAEAAVTVVAPLETYEATVLRDAPVAYWRLDETTGTTAADSAGNHTGTYMNGVNLGQPGALMGNDTVNLAAGFTQASQTKVEVPWSSALNTPQFTFECWAKLTGGTSHRSPMTSRGDNPQEGYIFYATPGNAWEFWTGSGGWSSIVGPAVQNNEWVYLAGTYDGTVKRLFVNGQQVGSAQVTVVQNDADFLRIGAGATEDPTGNYFFEGLVDEAAVYDKALSPAVIQTHYMAARPTPVELPVLGIANDAGSVVLTWDGNATLQEATSPTGTWTDLPGATSPFTVTPDSGQMYWRLTNP